MSLAFVAAILVFFFSSFLFLFGGLKPVIKLQRNQFLIRCQVSRNLAIIPKTFLRAITEMRNITGTALPYLSASHVFVTSLTGGQHISKWWCYEQWHSLISNKLQGCEMWRMNKMKKCTSKPLFVCVAMKLLWKCWEEQQKNEQTVCNLSVDFF